MGSILFIITYIIAALLYPGGSQAGNTSRGFSWLHNYWCNLLNVHAMNGAHNTARPVAITGLIILSVSLATFWYQFSRVIKFSKTSQLLMQVSGIISMFAVLFLFTSYHNIVINITVLLASFALAGTFTGLYKLKWQKLFSMGILNLVLIGVNNFVYYTRELIGYLPVVQKITFLFFLGWVCLIAIKLYKLNIPPT